MGTKVPSTGVFRYYNASVDVQAELYLGSSVKAAVLGGLLSWERSENEGA